ncbi:MAG: hypothetical protein QOK14_1600 [Frankiaceae bacterium]|nr:hypothetical protein [Frankiaceae bacterium]
MAAIQAVPFTAHPPDRLPARPVVDIVIPVHNEERDLAPAVRRLHEHLTTRFPYDARITIADNASTDGTWPVAMALADEFAMVRAVHLHEKGRGRALATAWLGNDADVLAYMDVDLSTDLNALLPLIAPLVSGHSDIAIGSRLTHSARVVRGPRREVISRSYNALLHAVLATRFSDAQCGFKAIRSDRAQLLLPLIEDTAWFFDTELLVLAERAGMRISEVPVDWVDDPDSRVDIVATALADLRGVGRLARGLALGTIPIAGLRRARDPQSQRPLGYQLVRFAAVGVASTIAYLLLYVALRGSMSAQLANLTALVVTTVGNTAVNRAWTFGARRSTGVMRSQLQGLAVFAVAWTLTAVALAVVHALAVTQSRLVEVSALIAANLLATVLRFVALRGWVFGTAARRAPAPASDSASAERCSS